MNLCDNGFCILGGSCKLPSTLDLAGFKVTWHYAPTDHLAPFSKLS